MRLRTAALALCVLAVSPLAAEAQTTCATPTFTMNITAFGGRTKANKTNWPPLGIEECIDEPITLELAFLGLPTTLSRMAVWEGSDCGNPTARVATTGSCTSVTGFNIDTPADSLTITMAELGCVADTDEPISLYFLPMQTQDDSTTDVTTSCDSITIDVDTVPPAAPTEVEGGSGETSVDVTWTSSSDDTESFTVYYDPDDTDCSSPLLVEGEIVDPTGLRGVTASKGATSKSVTIGSVLAVGESASVGVVAVDTAGNQSVLSNIGCMIKVETTSWLDLHNAQGGKTGSTCSVASVGRIQRPMLALWLTLLALVALRAARRVS